jgi:hypothetical protein
VGSDFVASVLSATSVGKLALFGGFAYDLKKRISSTLTD